MQPDIVCLGEPLLELNQVKGERYYQPGHGGDTSKCANAAAVLSTQGYGAVAPMPNREHVLVFLKS